MKQKSTNSPSISTASMPTKSTLATSVNDFSQLFVAPRNSLICDDTDTLPPIDETLDVEVDETPIISLTDEMEEVSTFDTENLNTRKTRKTSDQVGDQSNHRSTRSVKDDLELNSERYLDRGLIGSGGMGEVRRVFDQVLEREVAMKLIHQHLMTHQDYCERFQHEAQILSQLQHPNILPIYDYGSLPDGRLYFTMLEVRGKPLSSYIQKVHRESDIHGWKRTSNGWNLNRLLSVIYDLTKAISYAHERGVLHRDLKPDNVIIGNMGEVILVDWGLAHTYQATHSMTCSSLETDQEHQEPILLSSNDLPKPVLAGTPPYIAPELIYGDQDSMSPLTDLYSLGIMLYEVLYGTKPVLLGSLNEQLYQISKGGLIRFKHAHDFNHQQADHPADHPADQKQTQERYSVHGAILPYELTELCLELTRLQPLDRPQTAHFVADFLGRWLDGSAKREQALKILGEATLLSKPIAEMNTKVIELRSQVDQLSLSLLPWQNDQQKHYVWSLEDQANQLEQEISELAFQQKTLYHTALLYKPDLNEAHLALASLYKNEHQEAEKHQDFKMAWQLSQRLKNHASALSGMGSIKQSFFSYLSGMAKITLNLAHDVSVSIAQFELHHRQLILKEFQQIGKGTLKEYQLAPGSYLFKLKQPGHHSAIYPVYNRRENHLTGLDPSGLPYEIRLVPLGELSDDDCYVIGGWSKIGGDSETPNSLPETQVWIDSFVMKRFPVTHQEYLIFLNALLQEDKEELALHLAPRHFAPSEDHQGENQLDQLIYELTPDGFKLPSHINPQHCSLKHPVTQITWKAARAYASWLSKQTGQAWRLPMEYEWEKAARGVDGRSYPWGEYHDPSWSCMKDSHQEEVHMYEVGAFKTDQSIYGVRDMAGNTRDWCLDRFRAAGAPLVNGRLLLPSDDELSDTGFKSTRGGSYGNSASRARCADRDWWFPERSYVGRGVRLARSIF